MACGPNVDQAHPARGGSGAPHCGPCLARETPAGCPRQASPAMAIALLGGALAGSGPGTSPCIDGLSLTAGMVVPQRPAGSNHAQRLGTWDPKPLANLGPGPDSPSRFRPGRSLLTSGPSSAALIFRAGQASPVDHKRGHRHRLFCFVLSAAANGACSFLTLRQFNGRHFY
jgi:hypothetical protein